MTLRMTGRAFLAAAAFTLWHAAPAQAEAGEPVQSRLADHLPEIRAALAGKGAPAEAKITLAAPDALLMSDGDLAIETASYNAVTGRFLVRARGEAAGPVIAIVGSALAPATLPVLLRNVARNETISETDLDWTEIIDPMAHAYLADADLIIGKTARRPLAAGAPLRRADLQAPVLVRRGETATIILEAPGLRLTQLAVAKANGAAGDVITFRNVNSEREIKATVASKGVAKAPFAASSNYSRLEE